jgi:ABC-type uncharacterized transport system permease subunit
VTALAYVRQSAIATHRRLTTGVVLTVLGVFDLVAFGLFTRSQTATFNMTVPPAKVTVPNLNLPAHETALAAGALGVLIGLYALVVRPGRTGRRVAIGVGLFLFLVAFLCWAVAGNSLNFVGLLQGSVTRAVPLVLGALAGALCERSGVINIAIEGELLMGAFVGTVAASAAGAVWLGIISASLAGGLLGSVLAVFAIRYFVDQIVLGVVLNLLASGLTGYLYDRLLVPYQNTLNFPPIATSIKVPGLSDVPILGPVFFDATVFVYIAYVALLLIQVGLFHTRWGLRVRAVGEHPTAADTVGIRVLFTRYRNVIMGGMLAGIGGASLTIGSVGAFNKDISSGKGYIALAALVFGRWNPLGATVACLVFAFSDALQSALSIANVPIPSDILLMFPYLATLVAVAGLVGRVRPPRADGQPYVKG